MADLATKIQGLREAKAAFQALPERMRVRLNAATETTLSEIVRHAKARILASPSVQTRALLNSIGFSFNPNNGRGQAGVANVTTSITVGGRRLRIRGVLTAGAGGSALRSAGARLVKPTRYAHMIEFGTRRQPAEPFMVPAAQTQERPYLDRALRAGQDVERDLATIGSRGL